MVSVQRSIEIRVPVHTLYSQLTQFEEYPQFMQDIESVEKRDDTHLHWRAKMLDQAFEWDATITECVPDQRIAWQSDTGPGNAGRVELQSVGPAASRLTFTLVSEMDIEPTTPAGDVKAELSERIWEDLSRLRVMVEGRQQDMHTAQSSQSGAQEYKAGSLPTGQEGGSVAEVGIAQGTGERGSNGGRAGIDEVARLGSVEGTPTGEKSSPERTGQATQANDALQRDRGSPGNPVPLSGFAAGSEGFSGNEDPDSPVLSASRFAEEGRDASESIGGHARMHVSEVSRVAQGNPTQPDNSLLKDSEGGMQDKRDAIAEEVSFDQQSDRARQVGHFSPEDLNGSNEGLPNADVIAKAVQRKRPEPEV